MTYVLGRKSLAELQGVHPDLVCVVKRCIQITTQDFSVHDGIEKLEEAQPTPAGAAGSMSVGEAF